MALVSAVWGSLSSSVRTLVRKCAKCFVLTTGKLGMEALLLSNVEMPLAIATRDFVIRKSPVKGLRYSKEKSLLLLCFTKRLASADSMPHRCPMDADQVENQNRCIIAGIRKSLSILWREWVLSVKCQVVCKFLNSDIFVLCSQNPLKCIDWFKPRSGTTL